MYPINRVLTARRTASCTLTAVVLALSFFRAGSVPSQAARKSEASTEDPVPRGVTASDWQKICAAHEVWQRAMEPVKGGWQARNLAQQWTTKFDGRGFEAKPHNKDWTWGLELRSYGAGGEQCEVEGRSKVTIAGHRLSYHWDERVQEWFVNDARGLEHGFSVQERPPGPHDAPLTFVLATRGPLRAAVTGDARGVDYRDKSGATVLTYSGLRVWDADGRELDARFSPARDGVALKVDAKDARYPLLIDPVAQQAYVKASNPQTLDVFGESVAVSGDTVVVGAPLEDSITSGVNTVPIDVADYNSGAAYVFVRSGSTWTQEAYLKASNTDRLDSFGVSVAVSGDTVVVGAVGEDSNATSINGDQSNNGASAAGAAYVFVRSSQGVWLQQAYLKASNSETVDAFGGAVAISNDNLVVGAKGEDSNGTGEADNSLSNAGAAYVFSRNNQGTWRQRQYLKASNPGPLDEFGCSVAISGDIVVAGADSEDSNSTTVDGDQNNNLADNSGAAYVFERRINSWLQEAYLKASNSGAGDEFGTSVGVSGDTIIVGAPAEDSSANGINGNQTDNFTVNSGAAYVFVRNGTTWSQQAYVKASNTGATDRFGASVGISGDMLIIGAPDERSTATGVNGNQVDNSLISAGAAYFFERNATTWSQLAYVKASNTGGDSFGRSVALSGDTAVVAARGESSSATGVNGNQNDNSAISSGAAYVFFKVPPPVINSPLTAGGQVGTAFSYQITSSGGIPTSYAATGLPAGLSVNAATGAITGTPEVEGAFMVTLSASNVGGTGTVTLALEIAADVVSLKFLPPKRTVIGGKSTRVLLRVSNDLLRTQSVRVVFTSSDQALLPPPAPVEISAAGKKNAKQKAKITRFILNLPIPPAATAGLASITGSVGDQSASCELKIKAAKK